MQFIPSRSFKLSRLYGADHPGQIVQIILVNSSSVSPNKLHLPLEVLPRPPRRPGVVSGRYESTNKKSSSGSPNKSADILFAPPRAPRGLQEAHDLHLLVPGAEIVGGRYQPIKNLHLGVQTNLLVSYLPLQVLSKASRRHMAYTFWSLVLRLWVAHINQ